VKILDLNGKDVSLRAIAKKIYGLIEANGGKNYPVIIVLDKEERDIDFNVMASEVEKLIKEIPGVSQEIIVAVADRMIENWVLADQETLFGKIAIEGETDGKNGSAEIKKHSGSYFKTTDFPERFKEVNKGTVYANSPSYKAFVDKISGIKCHFSWH
jgi:hypothetical protein